MGFTKLDEGIVHSSIWAESYPTRVLWVTMLSMCNSHGFVPSSRSGLIRAANITEGEFAISIATLEGPDKDSRSPEYDGRRVEKRDGGWQVLNYPKYRTFTPQEGDPHSSGALRTRKWREKRHNAPVVTGGDVTGVTSASASSYSSLNKDKDFRGKYVPSDIAIEKYWRDKGARGSKTKEKT